MWWSTVIQRAASFWLLCVYVSNRVQTRFSACSEKFLPLSTLSKCASLLRPVTSSVSTSSSCSSLHPTLHPQIPYRLHSGVWFPYTVSLRHHLTWAKYFLCVCRRWSASTGFCRSIRRRKMWAQCLSSFVAFGWLSQLYLQWSKWKLPFWRSIAHRLMLFSKSNVQIRWRFQNSYSWLFNSKSLWCLTVKCSHFRRNLTFLTSLTFPLLQKSEQNKLVRSLQIPTHRICTGSLLKVRKLRWKFLKKKFFFNFKFDSQLTCLKLYLLKPADTLRSLKPLSYIASTEAKLWLRFFPTSCSGATSVSVTEQYGLLLAF